MPAGCVTRRRLIRAAVAAPLLSRAHAATVSWTFANNLPQAHPLNLRGREAAANILKATDGAVNVRVFPNGQLGSDTRTLDRLQSGGIDMLLVSGLVLARVVPAASLTGIGFAFSNYDQVWPAMDGALGDFIRGEIEKHGLTVMPRIWDNGFRQITTSTHPILAPEDLRGVKLRVPLGPLSSSLFSALGAVPSARSLGELYTSLQTRRVDGEENALAVIEAARLYEVQRYCSMTNHMWDGFWCLANRHAFERLPADAQTIVTREMNAAALLERSDLAALSARLADKLGAAGLQFNTVDPAPFRAALRTAGFYRDWHAKHGDAAWQLLDGAVGGLV